MLLLSVSLPFVRIGFCDAEKPGRFRGVDFDCFEFMKTWRTIVFTRSAVQWIFIWFEIIARNKCVDVFSYLHLFSLLLASAVFFSAKVTFFRSILLVSEYETKGVCQKPIEIHLASRSKLNRIWRVSVRSSSNWIENRPVYFHTTNRLTIGTEADVNGQHRVIDLKLRQNVSEPTKSKSNKLELN